jgi:hypothetical protein
LIFILSRSTLSCFFCPSLLCCPTDLIISFGIFVYTPFIVTFLSPLLADNDANMTLSRKNIYLSAMCLSWFAAVAYAHSHARAAPPASDAKISGFNLDSLSLDELDQQLQVRTFPLPSLLESNHDISY